MVIRIEILVEGDEQACEILRALDRAEECDALDFPFGLRVFEEEE